MVDKDKNVDVQRSVVRLVKGLNSMRIAYTEGTSVYACVCVLHTYLPTYRHGDDLKL
jgi:hypothetical protein